ncbi:uncharacterized protein [Enoplosus armatus]|uniref:uncharacterized protein n=1 Tax=Enoplosus armatus TaxID=215367 RepID=UPI0039961D7A
MQIKPHGVLCVQAVLGDRELAVKGEDGRLYHWILPSFFQLLKDLVQEGREFAILFRTFGTDLHRVLRAVYRALNEGAHPLFPDLPDLKLSVNMTPGKIRCSKKGIVLSRAEDHVSTCDGERGLYQYFSSAQGLGGFQDHFDWWASNTFSIRGGKPLWIDPFDQNVQHIFIDDNIRQNDEDTIVHPKVFLDAGGTETRTACTSELYDITLVQTDLLRAISDPSHFTHRVHICQENYERNLQQGAGYSTVLWESRVPSVRMRAAEQLLEQPHLYRQHPSLQVHNRSDTSPRCPALLTCRVQTFTRSRSGEPRRAADCACRPPVGQKAGCRALRWQEDSGRRRLVQYRTCALLAEMLALLSGPAEQLTGIKSL